MFILLTLGFPLALLFSWYYELTPEGLKTEREVDRSASIAQVTGKRLTFLTAALFGLALLGVVLNPFIGSRFDAAIAELVALVEDSEPSMIAIAQAYRGEIDDALDAIEFRIALPVQHGRLLQAAR